jgi:hypothetical protein
MTGFSIAAAEARFGPELAERAKESAARAPRFTAEQREKFRSLFAAARVTRPADTAADAA